MSKVITYNNVLNPLDRTILTHGNYKNIDEILKELKYDNEIYDLVISKNSVIQEGFFEVSQGDIVNITVVPKGGGRGGKNILGIIAAIVITVVSYGAGAAYGASVGSALGVSTATGTAIVSVGVAMAGSLLLNAVMPKPNATLDFNRQDFKNSQTYGWQKATNQAMQSQAIPKVFGAHKITPPLIASYIETKDDKQYFNALYALNDGEINSVSDIKINSEPIENFKGVTYEIRNGETTQDVIANFNDTHYDKPVGKKLPSDLSYVLSQTDGNAVTALTITLVMPRGLYYANDNGGISGYSINISIEYSNDKENWEPIGGHLYKRLTFDFDRYIFYEEEGPYTTVFNKDGVVMGGEYNELKAKVTQLYGVDTYSPTTIVSGATTSTFRKTFKVNNLQPDRYYVRAKFETAPDTGSRYGSDCYLEYVTETISDDFIYPSTALLAIRALATDQLSGNAPVVTATVSANSDNPAEVCRQILRDSGVDNSRIMPSFDEWASLCDEKGYKCNIVFDSELSVRKALDTVSLLGRASVLQAGSKFDVIMEKAELVPVQSFMFGMGNILSGTFKQTFLPLVDRANFIEITYYDKNKEYEPSIISVSNSPLENNLVLNKTSVTLVGCTDEAQARSYGRFMLNCNRYLTQTVEFEAHIDSLVCRYGDIIRVSHDVPQYGFSGRLLEDSAGGTLTLDRDIELDSDKTYAVQIKNEINEVKEFQVLELVEPNKVLVNLNGAEYKKYDIYAIGEVNKVSKLYRIIKISTGGEFTRQISAIEYIEDIYNDSEAISHSNVSSLGLGNLRITESLILDAGKNILTYVNLSWRGNALSYTVHYRKIGEPNYKTVKTYDSSFKFEATDGEIYEIIVSDSYGDRIETTHKTVGKLIPPQKVTNLTAKELSEDWSLSWEYDAPPLDFKEFRIYADGILVGVTTLTSFTTPIFKTSTQYRVEAVDTSNVKSSPADIVATVGNLPNIDVITTYYKNDELIAFWQDTEYLSRALTYEVRKGIDWENSQLIKHTKDTNFTVFSNGQYLIKAVYITKGGAVLQSEEAAILIVDETMPAKNVIFESIEHTGFTGAKINTARADDGLMLIGNSLFDDTDNVDRLINFDFIDGFAETGVYDSQKTLSLAVPSSCRIVSSLEYDGVNILNNFDAVNDVDSLKNFDGFNNQNIEVVEQISLSLDGINFSEYKPFTNGSEHLARGFKMRLALKTKDKFTTPIVKKYQYAIDVPDIYESGSNVSGDSIKTINFSNYFNATPDVQITILNANGGDDAVLSNQTRSGFDIEIINGGQRVMREFNYFVKGY